METPDTRPVCDLPDGGLTLKEFLRLGDCRLVVPEGGLTIAVPTIIQDKHGHPLDGDFDPHGANGCGHKDTPEWKAEHPRGMRKPTMAESIREAPTAPAETPKHDEAPKPVETTATVSVDQAVAQVKSLVPADTSPALLIGGAAVLAVVGGALKFGPSILKARAEARERDHEREMRKLEIEEKKAEQNDEQHGSCAAERATLSAKVTAVESKVDGLTNKVDEVGRRVEKAVSSVPQFDEDFDPESIEERLARLERAAKATKAAKTAKKRK